MRTLEPPNRVRIGLMGIIVTVLVIGVGQSFTSVPMIFAKPSYYGQFTDTGETWVLTLENCALTYVAGMQSAAADAGFVLPRSLLDEVIAKQTSFPEAVMAGKIKVSGNPMKLAELMGLMDEFPRMFEIVEPRRNPVS